MTPADKLRVLELQVDGLALEKLALQNRVADLEDERDQYREIAQRVLNALDDVTAERNRLLTERQGVA